MNDSSLIDVREIDHNTVAVIVSVNRRRSAQEAINAVGHHKIVNGDVLRRMPVGGTGKAEETVKVVFRRLLRNIGNLGLEALYSEHRIVPDPLAQAKVNELAPDFSKKYPNGTQWKNPNGGWDHISFTEATNGEKVIIAQAIDGFWPGGMWFAGVEAR